MTDEPRPELDPAVANVRIGRICSNDDDGPWYEVEIHHRATKRKFRVRLNGDQFARALTGMGFVYGSYEERDYRKGKDAT